MRQKSRTPTLRRRKDSRRASAWRRRASPLYLRILPVRHRPLSRLRCPPRPIPSQRHPTLILQRTLKLQRTLPVDPSALEKNPRSAQTRSKEARRERRAERRPGCLKITWSILKWEILWAAAGWLAYDALGQRYPWIVIPVGLLALLFMLRYLRRFRRTAIEGAA